MLDAEKRAEFDQGNELLGEVLPPHWKRLFDGCVNEGFREDQAMELVKAYIVGQVK
jgi:hypothetical protein